MSEARTISPRRFQFSLGTMLVLLTLFALWLGWELDFIRDRQAWIRANGPLVENTTPNPLPMPKFALPIWRHWLGDTEVPRIWNRDEWSDQDRANVTTLFPEANFEDPPNVNGVTWVYQPGPVNVTPVPSAPVPDNP
jgi:hypothetical protein